MGWESIGSNPTPFVTIFVSYLNSVSGGMTASVVCLPECVPASVRVFARTWQGVDWQTAQNPLIEFLLVCHLSFIGAFWRMAANRWAVVPTFSADVPPYSAQ